MLTAFVDLLFPPSCVACGRVLHADAFFCAPCDEAVERLPDEVCWTCCEPGSFSGGRCPRCAAMPPVFARAFAPFAHEGAISRAIHQFKYEDHPELAPRLAELLARDAARFIDESPGAICAIPLHRSRLWHRRYDQAELLARALAARLGRVYVDGLRRVRATQRQVGLSEAARVANVSGAFAATEELARRHVILVDDVFTTGATARAAAKAALDAGARSARVLTLARAYSL